MSTVPGKADCRLVGNSKVIVTVKTLTSIAFEEAELRISDTDQSTDGKARKLNFPAKLKESFAADNTQQIKIKFSVKDESAAPRCWSIKLLSPSPTRKPEPRSSLKGGNVQ